MSHHCVDGDVHKQAGSWQPVPSLGLQVDITEACSAREKQRDGKRDGEKVCVCVCVSSSPTV